MMEFGIPGHPEFESVPSFGYPKRIVFGLTFARFGHPIRKAEGL
jgi:hypothetical protein